MAIVGSLSTGNLIQGDTIAANTSTGIFLQPASKNTIKFDNISKNGAGGPSGTGMGVYLFAGASGNAIARDVIADNTGYGAFLYNSAGNIAGVARTGPKANAFARNGIANFREYTGPSTAPAKTTGASTPKGPKVKEKSH